MKKYLVINCKSCQNYAAREIEENSFIPNGFNCGNCGCEAIADIRKAGTLATGKTCQGCNNIRDCPLSVQVIV